MTNEIIEGKKILVMKSGLTYWISNETAERLRNQIVSQERHTFVHILEIDATINTAEIEEVTTPDKYDDMQKLKEGKWKCVYGAWHNKKETCLCSEEKRKEYAERKRIEKMREDTRPLTPSERERISKKVKEIGEHFKKTGSWK